MADSTAFDSRTESGSSPGPSSRMGLGRVRWTVCAMLFVATSINYMDRQVIAILKPTLEHSIGMTEVSYGYIVDAFQIAYAIGLLAAGRLIDKLGTRIGYMLVMAVWSLSAMGHALASTVLEFGFARFFLGLGESGNFPAAIKTVAEWFPQNERSLATGIFNSGANVGAILAPAIVPWVTLRWGWHAAFLTTGLFSVLWILWWFRYYRKPTDHATLKAKELQHIYQEAALDLGPSVPWRRLLRCRQTWAHRRRLVARALPSPRTLAQLCAACGNVLLRCFSRSHLHGQQCQVGVDRHCADQRCRGGTPGLVGQSLHDLIGYVSAQRRGFGGRYRWHDGIRQQRTFCFLCGPHSATQAQLWRPVRHRGQPLPIGSGRSVRARSRAKEGGTHSMSLAALRAVQKPIYPRRSCMICWWGS
ncbi:MAG: MFS transporter [Candidatus Sulfotelmatobacter sp.]